MESPLHPPPVPWLRRRADPAWQAALRARIDTIKRAHPIVEVAATFTRLSPIHAGSRTVVGLCPLHDERTPSFHVYVEQDTFYCFGCQAWGDVITLVQHGHQLSFLAALDYLESGLPRRRMAPTPSASSHAPTGLSLPRQPSAPHDRVNAVAPPPDAAERARRAHQSPAGRAALQLATDLYAQALWQTPRAQRYLVKRGVSEEVAFHQRLGYATGRGLVEHLARHHIPRQTAFDLGLLGGALDQPYERFAGRLMIPEVRAGHSISMSGRLVPSSRDPPAAPGGPPRHKYLNLSGDRVLGGVPLVAGQLAVYVCEGPFDWLTLVVWGLAACYVGGAPGGALLTAELLHWLRDARIVYLVADADAAGARHTHALQALLGARAHPVQLPPGIHDPNDLGLFPDGQARFAQVVHTAATCSSAMSTRPA